MSKKDKKLRIYSALEVANICGVVNQTAINWIKNNHLKAFTTPGGQYRIYAEDFYSFLVKRGMRIPEELEHLVKNEESRKILIIDDEKKLNDLIKDYLTRNMSKAEIYQAYDGFEAGKLLIEKKPSVIILDLKLPGIDGYELCRKIRSDQDFDRALIISISGFNSNSDRDKILKAGADEFMKKPLNFSQIAKAIRNFNRPG